MLVVEASFLCGNGFTENSRFRSRSVGHPTPRCTGRAAVRWPGGRAASFQRDAARRATGAQRPRAGERENVGPTIQGKRALSGRLHALAS